jgi:type I restriction enzyme S subunit
MNKQWPTANLGEVLHYRKEFITIDDLINYKRPRVRIHVQGIVLRDEVPGALIKTKKQQVCRTGEFLVAEIDAKVGGFGIVPESLDGSIVSSHYFLFAINETKLDRKFLDFFIRTSTFRDQVAAQGSTNYAAIRPAYVLDYKIPLPPLAEQRLIVARIEELASQIEEARGLRRQTTGGSEALLTSYSRSQFDPSSHGSWRKLRIVDVCETIIDYRGRTPPISENGIPHITSANIKGGKINWQTKKFVTAEIYAEFMTRGIPIPDDVLFTMEAPLGEVGIVPDNRQFSLAQRLILLRPKKSVVTGAFLARVLSSPSVREEVFAKATATTVAGIASKRLKEIEIPIPTLAQQNRIVVALNILQAEVERLKHLQAETAAELDALLPSVLSKAFAGEL